MLHRIVAAVRRELPQFNHELLVDLREREVANLIEFVAERYRELALVADTKFVVKSTADVNRFTADVLIPFVAVPLLLYTLKAAAAPVPTAAIPTANATFVIVIEPHVLFLQNNH